MIILKKKNLIESIDNNIISIDKSFQTNISDNNKINNEICNENELLILTNDENIINDEDNIQEKIKKNDEFNFHDFIKDFCDLGRLFWDSSFNFENEENFNYYLDYDIQKNEKINKSNELKNSIFSEEYFVRNNIKSNDIQSYVQFFFGDKNIKGPFRNEIKMVMKIFFISFISNKIIDDICGDINKKGFKYKSICSFYYNVLERFSKAINGFNELGEKFSKEKVELEAYKKTKGDEEK